MLSVSAIRKKSHASAINISKDCQKRRAGPYAPIEMKNVKKFAKVLTTILAGKNLSSHWYAGGSRGDVAMSKACMLFSGLILMVVWQINVFETTSCSTQHSILYDLYSARSSASRTVCRSCVAQSGQQTRVFILGAGKARRQLASAL